MIVQCKKCRTKYRFDESLIDGEGVWTRCSRCKVLFFLDKPATEEIVYPTVGVTDTGGIRVDPLEKKRAPVENDAEPDFTQTSKSFAEGYEEKPGAPEMAHSEPIRMEERDSGLKNEEAEKDTIESERDILKSDEAEGLKEQKVEEKAQKPESAKRSARSNGKQWVYLLVLLVLGGVYLWFFSEVGRQAADFTSSAVSTLFEKIHGADLKKEDVGPAQVDLADVRQRLVANGALGIIRVVEGTAINQSSHPMTRIRVMGKIVGDGGVLLDERESYCGNLLTGDELTAMTEEQFQRELSNPQGSDVSNDRIVPKGQIPFMIVFTREPMGVVKTYVVPSGAERLLP
jgi:predicted Zn finger-like uncharacterized protein